MTNQTASTTERTTGFVGDFVPHEAPTLQEVTMRSLQPEDKDESLVQVIGHQIRTALMTRLKGVTITAPEIVTEESGSVLLCFKKLIANLDGFGGFDAEPIWNTRVTGINSLGEVQCQVSDDFDHSVDIGRYLRSVYNAGNAESVTDLRLL